MRRVVQHYYTSITSCNCARPFPLATIPPSLSASGAAKLGAGESLYVVGNHAALGDNDASKATLSHKSFEIGTCTMYMYMY